MEQRNRFASPDSVILTTPESNLSIFSSSSEISLQQLGGGEGSDNSSSQESWWSGVGPPDHHHSHPNKSHISTVHVTNPNLNVRFHKTHNKPKDIKEEIYTNRGGGGGGGGSSTEEDSRNSFSLALKECQERRLRIKPDRRRPASLDLNNVAADASSTTAAEPSSSPGFGSSIKKVVGAGGGGAAASRRSGGNFPSPETPNYHHQRAMAVSNKGWSSERVPLPNNNGVNGRRQSHGHIPLSGNNNNNNNNRNGRGLPSKWEDAERWIFSPVNNPATGPSGIRKPKSKSGPLGPPGFAYHYSYYSPAVGGSLPVYEEGSNGGFVCGPSPFSAGDIGARGGGAKGDGPKGHHQEQQHVACPVRNEPCMGRSVSIHGCSEMVALQSFNSYQDDEKLEGLKDGARDISRAVSRRDMATQMSPEGSVHSSPSGRLSFSAVTPSAMPILELEWQSLQSSKAEVRDVQVDERVTVTRWSKRGKGCNRKKSSDIVDDLRKKTSDSRSSAWDVSETAKSISKATREEAKINAWENLQKAKAEAAIRKLEMKLEKKRSSSMDKIMNKLRSAQKRAQEMRSAATGSQAHQVSGTPRKAISFRKTCQMGSFSGCFACRAF